MIFWTFWILTHHLWTSKDPSSTRKFLSSSSTVRTQPRWNLLLLKIQRLPNRCPYSLSWRSANRKKNLKKQLQLRYARRIHTKFWIRSRSSTNLLSGPRLMKLSKMHRQKNKNLSLLLPQAKQINLLRVKKMRPRKMLLHLKRRQQRRKPLRIRILLLRKLNKSKKRKLLKKWNLKSSQLNLLNKNLR